ncbi:FadR/GntR family transcriptional regulator [Tissierella sp. MB52-C2]|uniref:FadR/GntR family transcriptional regulator n=1 Tax=Tissierella sp. MB52-C2 TaxID=3070999 RepID=UPI00280BDD83|nr:FadR/GntR family transcriptional regulator [Tissierella sp. MB52-C2]WMM24363.1 FadR/GntR family transcriptional regulator [Tissierella sp. MB52-C2]
MFESVNTKKNYEQIVEQIQELILDGTFKKGDKLPPERELTTKLGVSRSSLREALKALEVLGLIESKQGEGSYISNNVNSTILKSISIAYKLNNGTIEDILELRHSLEIQAVRTASIKATEEQIEELEVIVNKMEDAIDEDEQSQLDIEFHGKLIGMMNNVMFQIISDSVSNLMQPFIKSIREIYKEHDEYLKTYYFVEQHRNVLNAIKERNPEKAVNLMMEHIQLTEKDLLRLNSVSNKKL